MKNIYFILFVLLAIVSSTNAQTISRKVVSNGGGTLSGGESQITFTIGETFAASSAMLTSGFQQPGESIRTGIVSSSLCSGSTFNLPYTATDIGGGNTFTAQLSSDTGSFANPITIGTLAGNASSAQISVTIPYNVIVGSGYRIRVNSSSPSYIGADNGADISILEGPNVGNIIGAQQICVSNQTVQYTTSTNNNRGSWSSSNPSVATINNGGGLKALAPGTTVISYSIASPQLCGPNTTEFTISVLGSPIAGTISGTNAVCVGSNAAFNTNGNSGGVWNSTDTNVATVNSAGLVTSIGVGTTTITYTVNNDCGTDTASKLFTVLPVANAGIISGAALCIGTSTVYSSNGNPGGVWSSNNTARATVNASTGVVTPISAGLVTLSYTVNNGACSSSATKTITVSTTPSPGTLNGVASVCLGTTTTIARTGGVSGGVWSSSNTTIATISSTGVVTPVSAGTVTIFYTVTNAATCSASASKIITVNPLPNAGTINGAATLCIGSSTLYSTNGNVGGVWSSNNTARATVNASTGVVTPISAGTVTITYTVNNGACSASATKTITVSTTPSPGTLNGVASVCLGTTTTIARTGGVSGGVWSSSNTTIATISSTGVVTPVSAGTVTIFYTVTNAATCSASASKIITVNPLPNAGTIFGETALCVGTSTLFTSNGNPGGVWSSNNSARATVNSSTGLVTALTSGSVTITYGINNGTCTAATSKVITVAGSLLAITCPTGTLIRSTNASCQYSIVGAEFNAIATNGGCAPITYTYSLTGATTSTAIGTLAGVTLNKGITTITCTATSGSLNRTCSITVTVADTTLPVITCPSARSIKADKNKCFATLKFTDLQQPSFSDNCSGAVLTHNLVVAGNNQITLPIGVNSIIWTVTDTAGNKTTCIQNITVLSNGGNCTILTKSTTATVAETTIVPNPKTQSIVNPTVLETAVLDVIAYPNPSNSLFTLSIQGAAGKEKVVIRVFDTSGKQLYYKTGTATENYSFGDELGAGMYILEVQMEGKVHTSKLIKK